MTTLTLLANVNGHNRLKQIEKTLKLAFEGLDVETKILGIVADRWVQIALTGEDKEIATNYVIKEIGLCPTSFENVRKFSTLKGYITSFKKNGKELPIDVGVFQPKFVHATVPLRYLQGQLVDGRKVALGKIAELYGFCEDLPVSVKVSHLNKSESQIEAELSNEQVKKYMVWGESLLDRLVVLEPSFHEIKMTLERVNLDRDVIGVEPLGTFEHALTCKLGTDAAGLIPKIGRTLKKAKFSVFNPKKVRRFLALQK
jgi:hypothetical protein